MSEKATLVVLTILAALLTAILLGACQTAQHVNDATKGVAILGETIQVMDLDGNGNLSFMEIITWFYGLEYSGRAVEGTVKIAAKKVRNGRRAKRGTETCEA